MIDEPTVSIGHLYLFSGYQNISLLMMFILLLRYTRTQRYCVTVPVALGFAIVACGIGAAAFTLETYLLYYTHSNETGNSSMFRKNGKPFSTWSRVFND